MTLSCRTSILPGGNRPRLVWQQIFPSTVATF